MACRDGRCRCEDCARIVCDALCVCRARVKVCWTLYLCASTSSLCCRLISSTNKHCRTRDLFIGRASLSFARKIKPSLAVLPVGVFAHCQTPLRVVVVARTPKVVHELLCPTNSTSSVQLARCVWGVVRSLCCVIQQTSKRVTKGIQAA